MAESILIVEDEDDIARLLALALEAEGYECHTAGKGEDALSLALELAPDLVLLDLMLPGIDGVEVCRLLRKDPRTAFVAIIMLTARTLPADRVAGLEAGADDYVDKPFDLDEVLARVHRTLLRGRQLRATSPLTGLPGNFVIEAFLDRRIAEGQDFGLLHIDLDGFKAYNDHYGFVRGDRAIALTARMVLSAVEALGGQDAFVGHIGGDDFAVVCDADQAEAIAAGIVERFDEVADSLYDPDDRAQGYIEVVDRSGGSHRSPMLSISVGVADSRLRDYRSSTEAAAVAVELKRFAKAVPGSAWRIDRRRS